MTMKEILPILVLAACPLSMALMGAAAWVAARFRRSGSRSTASSES